MAEYIDDSNVNNYKITITGLEPGFDFVTYIYVQDLSGNLANENITKINRTLFGVSEPIDESAILEYTLDWYFTNATQFGMINTTSVYLNFIATQFPATIYAIAVRNPR